MRFFTELQETAVLSPEDAAMVIDNTRRMRDKAEHQVVGQRWTRLLPQLKGSQRFYREIPFGCQTYLELREEIALKFRGKPVQVLQIFKVPDTLIADDEGVHRLARCVLEILLKT